MTARQVVIFDGVGPLIGSPAHMVGARPPGVAWRHHRASTPRRAGAADVIEDCAAANPWLGACWDGADG